MQVPTQIADAVVTMPMTAGSFWARDAKGGIPALFADRRVHYAFQTRVAIRAACDVLGLQAGDEVLAPAYNCGSELDPLVHAGLKVRLYPVDADLLVAPERIEPLITNRTKAVYVIHYFGMLQPDLAAVRSLCDRHGLRMIEDCALSLLSGKAPAEGYTGDVSVFCFHKFAPVLQGGALVVNAPDLKVGNPFPRPAPGKPVVKTLARAGLANVLGPSRSQRMLRRLRGQRHEEAPCGAQPGALEDMPRHYYFDPGLCGRGISAFAARSLQAFSASGMIAARQRNWRRYCQHLNGMQGIRMLLPELGPHSCPLTMPVVVDERDHVARELQARGIGATPWWAGFSRNLDWMGQDGAMALKDTVLSLPLHQFLGDEHVDYIMSVLQGLIRDR
ncbi:UDP-4-amino-4-deoxy-L-arabinose--oxoglutarate aminotransferase [Ruegeria meonggei]|uniref:UDP-4-amino-4-deoxy-L-arabinose--oxoglutarate aminotransferase n=2 Tax=Ruegeria meonggei TaxID=1446476 RepID=A0A1X7ACL0_9RHOB|nr:UDP-4-amino-4-deoxy-L-arabinose--oxoglutarate aminotransferase [Ruegeria meonggei]